MASERTTFVLIHGAWGGGWNYQRVAEALRAKGHVVYAPSLTGCGERAHLLDGNINLSLHIQDVLNLFKYEGIERAVLAGHSYGGMVITGVADKIAEDDFSNLGDTTTLADPAVVDDLVNNRPNKKSG